MPRKIDLTGQKFGRLAVLRCNGRQGSRHRFLWECKCDCGNTITALGESLKSGNTRSCGCLKIETIKKRATTHGMSETNLFNTWLSMLQRCINKNNEAYINYGARGISVCDRWLTFKNFFADMGNKPIGLTLERSDNNGGYCKENCSWESRTAQNRNRRVGKNNKTGVKGVFFDKRKNKYVVSIHANDKRIHLGTFKELKEAAVARKAGEKKYWGKEKFK